jgi:undecaprenyl-phosphate galactose phosphotransferase/putative colanic acid biosynthesis UDP-glucose lipid carrier transferase
MAGSKILHPGQTENPTGFRSSKLRFPYAATQYASAAADAVLIVLASLVGNWGYQIFANEGAGNADAFLGVGLTAGLLYVLIAQTFGFYQIATIISASRDYRQIFVQWSLVCLILTLLAFLMKVGAVFSRGSIVCFAVLALGLILAFRRFTKKLVVAALSDRLLRGRRALVIGSREELAALDMDALLSKFGLFEVDRVEFGSDKQLSFSIPSDEIKSLETAVGMARERGADEIVLAFPWSDTRKLELIRDRLRALPLPVQLLPDRRIRSVVENPAFTLKKLLSIEIQRSPLTRLEQFSKRAFDIVGATIALVILAPLMVVAAVTVKLDSPGPILFRQRRNGFNVHRFVIFKFRTMNVLEDGGNVVQAKRHDARVTRVGRVLRRSSIDELPQLFNVLRGEMSLVGPRPHALAHDTQYGNLLLDYAFRQHMKPGITGWAQVNGYRGETAGIDQMKRRIDFDLWYINNWSFILDLQILCRTCIEVTRQRNAY